MLTLGPHLLLCLQPCTLSELHVVHHRFHAQRRTGNNVYGVPPSPPIYAKTPCLSLPIEFLVSASVHPIP